MKSIVLIQARVSSTRLPCKVLLPINNVPLVVVVAQRAGNTGKEILVVTSNDYSDDILVYYLELFKIPYYRGELENVLNRFVSALSTYEEDRIVFRLTADNPFPDGRLLDEIETDFISGKHNYLICNGAPSGVPHGVSVEVTYLKHLRDANLNTLNVYDREHVTPYLARKFGSNYFTKYKDPGSLNLSCTIDTFEDYLKVANIFENSTSISTEDCEILINKLINKSKNKSNQRSVENVSKLILGTAQLGTHYGINNKTGKPDITESNNIIQNALSRGIKCFDTARAYGESEYIIGESIGRAHRSSLEIITKLDPLIYISKNINERSLNAIINASVYESCYALKTTCLDVLLLHNSEHLFGLNGRVWRQLLRLKNTGRIKKLGISVQDPTELLRVLDISEVMHIQMPLNILDWRWERVYDKIKKVKKQRELLIHVRSPFLQGLLFSQNHNHWCTANVQDYRRVLDWLSIQISTYGKSGVSDLCLTYLNSIDWIDGIVIGVEESSQLDLNLKNIYSNKFTEMELKKIDESRPILNEASLNPSLWRK